AVPGRDPEEQQLVDLADQPIAPRVVEQRDRWSLDPVRVVGDRKLRQLRCDLLAGGPEVPAESQQGVAQALAAREQLVGLVRGLLGLASQPGFLPDGPEPTPQPGIALGELAGCGVVAQGQLEPALLGLLPCLGDPLTHLTLEAERGVSKTS